MDSFNKKLTIPLLSLPSLVLPNGIVSLRIHEAPHIRMIKESFKNSQGFGIVTLENADELKVKRKIANIGTRVEIIDFYTRKDGFLGITVQGKESFSIQHTEVAEDGLEFAEVSLLPNWPNEIIADEQMNLSSKLLDLFNDYPQLNKLYINKEFNNLTWLCQRWLEILPISVEKKQHLIAQTNCHQTEQLLSQFIKD